MCLQPGKQRGQVLLGLADKTALPALQLAFPCPQRRRRPRRDHAHHRFCLHQVDAAVHKRAARKLARLGRTRAQPHQPPHHQRGRRRASVGVDFAHVLARVGPGRIHDHAHGLINGAGFVHRVSHHQPVAFVGRLGPLRPKRLFKQAHRLRPRSRVRWPRHPRPPPWPRLRWCPPYSVHPFPALKKTSRQNHGRALRAACVYDIMFTRPFPAERAKTAKEGALFPCPLPF